MPKTNKEKRILRILADKPTFDLYCICCGFYGFEEDFIRVLREYEHVFWECPRCRAEHEYIYTVDMNPFADREQIKKLVSHLNKLEEKYHYVSTQH